MKFVTPLEGIAKYKEFSTTFYPEILSDNTANIEEHEVIQIFKKRVEGNEKEKCFFVVNMISGKNQEPEISYSHNAKELLNSPHFELIDYFRMLPSLHLTALMESSTTIFQQLKGYKHEFSSENHYQVYTPIRVLHGDKPKYLLAKRKLYPFQYTADNTLYSYINELTIEDRFLTESQFLEYPLQPLILFDVNNIEETFSRIIKQNLKIENFLPFSPRQIDILKEYGTNENLTSEMLAVKFNISRGTLLKHQTNLLEKCENLGLKFIDTKQAARYFTKWWLI